MRQYQLCLSTPTSASSSWSPFVLGMLTALVESLLAGRPPSRYCPKIPNPVESYLAMLGNWRLGTSGCSFMGSSALARPALPALPDCLVPFRPSGLAICWPDLPTFSKARSRRRSHAEPLNGDGPTVCTKAWLV